MTDSKVSEFDTKLHEETVEKMEKRSERVSAEGEKYFAAHASLHPLIDPKGTLRVSHNSLVKATEGWVLTNGIALSNMFWYDGTGSVGKKVAEVFKALSLIDSMHAPFRARYNMQIATGVLQDIKDAHGPVMHTQFETDNRIAEQMRLLIPDLWGDDHIEEYDLALLYSLIACDLDINRMYGLKGHMRIIGDEIGYDCVSRAHALEHIGHTIQGDMTPADICKGLLKEWHPFYVNIGSDERAPRADVTAWWREQLGANRVVECHTMDLLDETLVGITYCLETAAPTKDGLVEVLWADGANKKFGTTDADDVWKWLQAMKPHFGDQTKLPGYNDIPLPGAIFEDMRHAWPKDHPKAAGQAVFPGAAKTARKVSKSGRVTSGWDAKKF